MSKHRDPDVTRLTAELEELKHQYDLYFSGQRRTEPVALMRQVERGVQEIMRSPVQTTMIKFQMRTLAQRFRSFQTQVKNLLDLKFHRASTAKEREKGVSVIIDSVAAENPNLIAARVRSIAKELALNAPAEGAVVPTESQLTRLLMGKARSMLSRGDVVAVRFSLTRDSGAPKLKGEIISRVPEPEPSEG